MIPPLVLRLARDLGAVVLFLKVNVAQYLYRFIVIVREKVSDKAFEFLIELRALFLAGQDNDYPSCTASLEDRNEMLFEPFLVAIVELEVSRTACPSGLSVSRALAMK